MNYTVRNLNPQLASIACYRPIQEIKPFDIKKRNTPHPPITITSFALPTCSISWVLPSLQVPTSPRKNHHFHSFLLSHDQDIRNNVPSHFYLYLHAQTRRRSDPLH